MSSQVLYKDYFNPEEAAAYCGVSPEVFERTIRNRIPCIWLTRRTALFRRTDLHDWEDFPPGPQRTTMYARLRQIALAERTPAWADREKIAAIYAEARRISTETGVRHHVDHIFPIRGKHVSGLHVHGNLRIVPAEVNFRKGNR